VGVSRCSWIAGAPVSSKVLNPAQGSWPFKAPVLLDQDGCLFPVTLSVAMYPAEPSGLRAPSSSSISGAGVC